MQQSNAYIIRFTLILTVVLGLLLAGAATIFKEPQEKAEALDTKKQILGAVIDLEGKEQPEIEQIYANRISSLVVNNSGEKVEKNSKGEDVSAEGVEVNKEYKKLQAIGKLQKSLADAEKDGDNEKAASLKARIAEAQGKVLLPVYRLLNEKGTKVEAYILPVYGNGLWDNIWGYVALETNLTTIKGVVFDHKGETPGLGARITEGKVQGRYAGKKIYNETEQLVSVTMVKGEGNDGLSENQVDGMSGATITANGVNVMLSSYFKYYQNYLAKVAADGNAKKVAAAL